MGQLKIFAIILMLLSTTITFSANSLTTSNEDLVVIVSPQYKDDTGIITAIQTYLNAVYADIGWIGKIHKLSDSDNTNDNLLNIVKGYYQDSGGKLKAVMLVGEDIKIHFGHDYDGQEKPNTNILAALQEPLPPVYCIYKILPTLIFPNADDPYPTKKDEIIFAFTKFSNRWYDYGNTIRGYKYPFEGPYNPSEDYMENALSPIGDITWINNASVEECNEVYTGNYKAVFLDGHGTCISIYLKDPYTPSFTSSQIKNIKTPAIMLAGCFTDGWGGIDNGILEPPNEWFDREFFGHTILTDDNFRFLMTGTGGICGNSDGNITEPDIVVKLASGKTFAEALIGDNFISNSLTFYGDPTFSFDFKPDSNPPTTTFSSIGTKGDNEWYIAEPVRIILTANDDFSGIAETRYRMNGGSWITYSEEFEISNSGIYTIEYYSIDNSGKKEAVKQEEIKIDMQKPSTRCKLNGNQESNNIFIERVTVTFTASDDKSSVAETKYRINEQNWQTYSSSFEISDPGVYDLKYYSRDLAGNDEEIKNQRIIVVLQNTKPDKPKPPTGPQGGEPGQEYQYAASTTDPDGDKIYYLFDWGDGTDSGWLGPYPSGEKVTESHVWGSKNPYGIRVQAKDTKGSKSEWSENLTVVIPRTRSLQKILERIVNKNIEHQFPILQFIMKILRN